jgi:hypothetical protein
VGYYKQQEVAGQTEVADRVPAPRRSLDHAVFFPERRMRRHAEQRAQRNTLPWLVAMWALTMFIMGMTLGIVL